MKTLLSPTRPYLLATDPTQLLHVEMANGGFKESLSLAATAEFVDTEGIMGLLGHAVTQIGPAPVEDSRFGSYRIVKSLGKGGFGDVWLAEQQAPVHREVALKLIRSGTGTREVISRFKRERQAMAMMEHENIAKMYDASSVDGTHYFAMEYVPGMPITKHVKNNKLTLRQRIELFIPVCRAVHHAHQKRVLHRDLKPANILIVERDGVAVPKVIDFGIAKQLSEPPRMDATDTEDMPVTQPGYCLGTPQYMSPEQAMGLADIDPASDTYALGIVLYEMLVGEPPITKDEMEGLPPHQQLERVIQHETQLPSTVWLRSTAANNTRRYDTTLGDNPKRISHQIRGDLDWIVRKALEKDRSQRYPSADKLADDLSAYLRNEPISVGPPSLSYRWRKSYRRHRFTMLASSLTLFAMLSVGIAFEQWQRAETASAQESNARAASDLAKTETMEMVNLVLSDLGSELEAVNEASLRQRVTTKSADFGALAEHDSQHLTLYRGRSRVNSHKSRLGVTIASTSTAREIAAAQ